MGLKKCKTAVATLTFAIAFALVGSPSAPVAKVVPTVGGVAHAYAPCDALFWGMIWAAQAHAWNPTFDNLVAMIRAYREWYDHCGG